jgi:hypothetical protein
MRRLGLLAREGGIRAWGFAAKGTVGSVVVVEMGEGVDVLVQAIEPVGRSWQA